MHRYADNPTPIILAHRGGAGEAPEHTLEAYQNAVDQGCNYLELDVRLNEAAELILQHGRRTGPKVPLKLLELITAFPDKYFAIDPKEKQAVKPLAEFILQCGLVDQVCIGASLDNRALEVARLVEKSCGSRPAVALVSARAGTRLLTRSAGLGQLKPISHADYFHLYNRLVTKGIITTAHQSGLKLIAWPVNDPARMQQLIDWDADGFMTDVPTVAAQLGLLR